ncbi:MAG: hypothetical protein Q9M23_04395, partial [Mariprofundaceae bacterium]|nr:hypothetical protein [Mariprofundaceae bacterium]
PEQEAGIGPFTSVHARLLVIEPSKRWQVLLDWHADSPTSGHARMSHAASNTVVELRWQHDAIEMRDNASPAWRKLSTAQLAEQGIVVSPYTLSRFLAGRIPAGFTQRKVNLWESRRAGGIIRVQWHAQAKRLEISDIRHGKRATLIILHGEIARPGSRIEPPHA